MDWTKQSEVAQDIERETNVIQIVNYASKLYYETDTKNDREEVLKICESMTKSIENLINRL